MKNTSIIVVIILVFISLVVYLEVSPKAVSNLEKVTPFATIFIALCSLFYTATHINANKEHNELSVTPILDVETNIIPGYDMSFGVVNFGIGVAVVKKIETIIDGNKYTVDTIQKMKEIFTILNIHDTGAHYHMSIEETYILPGNHVKIFSLPKIEQNEVNNLKFLNALKRIQIEIKYESLYKVEKILKYSPTYI